MSRWAKFAISVVVDFIGSVPYLVALSATVPILKFLIPLGPFVTLINVIWAPISAGVIYLMYKNPALGTVAFFEQVIPYPLINLIPTATIAWLVENLFPKKVKASYGNLPSNNFDVVGYCKAKYQNSDEINGCIKKFR